MNNLQELGASVATIERQRDYGHPYHDFTRIAGMLSALGYEFPEDRDLPPAQCS